MALESPERAQRLSFNFTSFNGVSDIKLPPYCVVTKTVGFDVVFILVVAVAIVIIVIVVAVIGVVETMVEINVVSELGACRWRWRDIFRRQRLWVHMANIIDK